MRVRVRVSVYFATRQERLEVQRNLFVDVCLCVFGQSAETGQRDEYELERQAGRASAWRPPAGDDRCTLRDTNATAGAHQERRVLPERGQRGQAGHGGNQGTIMALPRLT